MFKHIGYKIITVSGSIVVLTLVVLLLFYTTNQKQSILAQNERSMTKLTRSVSEGLQTVMIAGYADVAEVFAERLQSVPEVADFRVLRTNGDEAFNDNLTIDEVNERRGDEEFDPRDDEEVINIIKKDHPQLKRMLDLQDVIYYYETVEDENFLTFLAPIKNDNDCFKCHGRDQPIRGVLKLTTSMSAAEADIEATRNQALLVMLIAIITIVLLTGYMIRRAVVHPITTLTSAMAEVSKGDLSQEVPVIGRDELSRMALSFNSMSKQLLNTYQGLESEQDKLTTIILSAREGIVVTNSEGQVVLTNPAAEALLEKSTEDIIQGGFLELFDDPEQLKSFVETAHNQEEAKPEIIHYKGRILSLAASEIIDHEGDTIGSAALFRDITEEKRLEEKLRHLSTTDALTGLWNRRYLDSTIKDEYERCDRYGLEMAVIMFDVDHFKRFNDEHGHDQGDRVLQFLGETIKETVRTTDIACRYGGEEFTIILTNTDHEGSAMLAERLRQRVEEAEVDGLRVTISLGVANFSELNPENADALIEAADKALYAAKEGGRNCVSIAKTS